MSHIAIFLPELEAGGAQRVMLMLAEKFASRGHKVDLILMRSTGALITSVHDDVRIVDLGARAYGLGQLGLGISSVIKLSSCLRNMHPDVMLSTITGANIVALLARKLSGLQLPLIIREAVTLKNISSVMRIRVMRWLYPQADAVIALSPYMQEELVREIGVSHDQVKCIANPVDISFIRQQAETPVDHPWFNDEQFRVIVAVGRLIPQKDFSSLLRAFSLLRKDSRCRLVIVGEGPEREALEKLAVETGIEDRIDLVGFDINPWRWVSRADLFVLSSKWEGHPNALLEALVLGKPVVITRYDVSVHEVLGALPESHYAIVDVGDHKALSDSIARLIGVKGYTVDDYLNAMNIGSISDYEYILLDKAVK